MCGCGCGYVGLWVCECRWMCIVLDCWRQFYCAFRVLFLGMYVCIKDCVGWLWWVVVFGVGIVCGCVYGGCIMQECWVLFLGTILVCFQGTISGLCMFA